MSNLDEQGCLKPFLLQRADPFVTRWEGRYYFTASCPEYDRIELRVAETLEVLSIAEPVTVWRKHTSGDMSQHIWAPELHCLDGVWYIYFAASRTDDIWRLRPYVLRCHSKDPMTGPWEELGQMQPAEGNSFAFSNFSLDATLFENRGERYFVWAQKVDNISNLYIARMKSPWQLADTPVLLTEPEYEWEKQGGFWVNEGPAVIQRGSKLFLTFSASATGACYCMGMLEAEENADLLCRNNWKKCAVPIFSTQPGKKCFGPGHNSFTTAPDGSDLVIFHARPYEKILTEDPLYDPNRNACSIKLEWDANGRPLFKIP